MTKPLAIHQQAVSVFHIIAAAEDREQWRLHFGVLRLLLPLVFDPDLRLLDVEPDPDDGERRQHADPQHAAPADVVVDGRVQQRRHQIAERP